MKKIFTLLACVLMAGSAFGQGKVTLVNSNLEGTQDPTWSYFWTQDGRLEGVTDEATGQGYVGLGDDKDIPGWRQFAEIVDDPVKANNHCIKVHVRSQADGEAAGNLRQDGGTIVSWDTQFFIYTKEEMPVGKFIRLKMKVRGDIGGSFDSQAHETPGEYTYYTLFGNYTYSTKWETYTTAWTEVTSNHVTNEGHSFFRAIAFNLASSNFTEGNNIYFDDIKLEMADEKPEEEVQDEGGFFNFLRHGTESADVFNLHDRTFTTFTARNFLTGDDEQAEIITDTDGLPAIKVTALDVQKYTVLDAEGNPVLDENGEPTTKTGIIRWNEEKQQNDTVNADDWLCQFFVTVHHKFTPGEKYRIKFKYRADKASNEDGTTKASFDSQIHTYPGDYKHYAAIGSKDFTTEWQDFEPIEGTLPSSFQNSSPNCQTIAFNLYKLKEANNYYFRFEEISFTEGYIKDEERTLGSADLDLPVNSDIDEKSTTIDMADALKVLEAEDFSFMTNETDGMKLFTQLPPKEEGDDPIETFSNILPWTDGGFVNGEGYYVDSDFDQGVQIRFNDETIDGTKINLNVWNNAEAGISFADGNTLNTKLCISKGGWYYVYNIALMSEDTFAGINGIKQVKADNGLIYNIAGQRVDGSYKGLVIKNGQKFVQK